MQGYFIVTSLPPPPVVPRRRLESGTFEIDRRVERKPTLRLRARRRLPVDQAEDLQIPYRDDWKSPRWVLAYCIVTAVLLWVLTR